MPTVPNHVVSVKQAAARVGVSEKTMLRWVSGGAVVAFRHGRWGHWYVRVDEHGWPLRALSNLSQGA